MSIGQTPHPWGNQISGGVGPGAAAVQAGTVTGGVRISLAVPGAAMQAPLPVPRQVPPPTAAWVDRDEATERLDGLLDPQPPSGNHDGDAGDHGGLSPDRPTVAVIIGPGGIGKSALAMHWLHRHLTRFDGHLYADLHSYTPGSEVQAEEVLARFLRALGVPAESVPVSGDEMAALYRTILAGRNMAVLLDDVRLAKQVLPLVAQGTSLVVITTRERHLPSLATTTPHYIHLEPLRDDAVLALLRRIVGADRIDSEPQAARQLAGLCGGWPLAAVIAGARVASRRHAPIRRWVDRLTDTHQRLELTLPDSEVSIMANIDASFTALDAPQQRLFMALGEHPGPSFDACLAAAAIGVHPDEAEDLLEGLAGASLITDADVRGERYRWHDLVRAHARKKAAAAEQRELAEIGDDLMEPREETAAAEWLGPGDPREVVFARIVQYYLGAVVEADLVVLANRPQLGPMYPRVRAEPQHLFGCKAEALDWVDAELSNIHSVIREAYRRGMHPEAWQLTEGLWGYFVNRRQHPEWMATHEIGLAAACAVNDVRAEQKMLLGLAQVYLSIHEFGQAATRFEEALALSDRAGYPVGKAAALSGLGTVAQSRGYPNEAIGYYKQAQSIHEAEARPRGIAMTQQHIGEAHRKAGRPQEALNALARSLEIFESLGDEPYNVAKVLTELGATRLELGEPDVAVALLERALTLAAAESPYRQASALQVLARARKAAGDHAAAMAHLKTAVRIFTDLGAPEAEHAREELQALHADKTS